MEDIYRTYLGKAYRFITFEGFFNTLANHTLRFTRAGYFNDPLDLSAYITNQLQVDEPSSKNLDITKTLANHIQNRIFGTTYLCCFCKEYKSENSYLMWAHYGQSHSQMCFEIDFEKYKFLGGPSHVIYPFNLRKFISNLESRAGEERGVGWVLGKSKIWAYEKEVRLIIDITHSKLNFSNLSFSNEGRYLFHKFDPSIITKIVFGVNSKRHDEIKALRLMQSLGLHPKFEKMVIRSNDINLDTVELSENEIGR